MTSTRPGSVGMERLRGDGLGEEQVVGRVDVELQDARHLDERDVGGGREPRVAGPAVAAERRVDRVRRVQQQRVRPAAVAVGGEDDARRSRPSSPAASRRSRSPAATPGRSAGQDQQPLPGRGVAGLLDGGVEATRPLLDGPWRRPRRRARAPRGPARRRRPRPRRASRAPRSRCPGAAARRGRGAPRGRGPRPAATSRPRRPAPGSTTLVDAVTRAPPPAPRPRAGPASRRRS